MDRNSQSSERRRMMHTIIPAKEVEEEFKTRKTGHYCHDCKCRLDAEIGQKPFTQKGPFCWAGYTQNPLGIVATINALKAGGQVCHYNPDKRKAVERLGL
jgi:hypothetical protein